LLVHGVWNLTAVLASLNILDQVISVVITILIFVLVLIGYIAFTRKDRNQTREMVISNGL
jgi:hypothetical protein